MTVIILENTRKKTNHLLFIETECIKANQLVFEIFKSIIENKGFL